MELSEQPLAVTNVAYGVGSTGLMKVVFCYAIPTVVQGFGANETLHIRTTTRLSSDQWTRLHVRIVHPKWSCDQSNQALRWRNVNCGHFMGRHTRIPWWWRRLITVRVLMWPPNAKLHNSGFSHRRGADHFRVNHSIIVRLMQRFCQTGNVTDRPRAGRPRKTTPREDRLHFTHPVIYT
jgi:hypothetical protein